MAGREGCDSGYMSDGARIGRCLSENHYFWVLPAIGMLRTFAPRFTKARDSYPFAPLA